MSIEKRRLVNGITDGKITVWMDDHMAVIQHDNGQAMKLTETEMRALLQWLEEQDATGERIIELEMAAHIQALEELLQAHYGEIVLGRQLSDDATWQDIHAWDKRVDALQKCAEQILPDLSNPQGSPVA